MSYFSIISQRRMKSVDGIRRSDLSSAEKKILTPREGPMARASAVKMPPEANAAHGCEGARRVLALMLTFSADDHTLTARQVAGRPGIALPSVYRYLTLLRETGLLAGDERGSYRLSARLVGLARPAAAGESIFHLGHRGMPGTAA